MEKRAIACNYRIPTSYCSKGAKAYVRSMPGMLDRVEVVARSRSGRWITRWEPLDQLENFREVTLANPLLADRVLDAALFHGLSDLLNREAKRINEMGS